jgi:hypothetical protein
MALVDGKSLYVWLDIAADSMTSLRFAKKKFCFLFRIKHFYAFVWRLSAES